MKTSYLIFGISLSLLFCSCKKESTADSVIPTDHSLKLGLIAYYPFNKGAADESGNGYDLSVRGATLTTNRFGETQKAYAFNGTSDFMIIPGILKADSLREVTISAWVKVADIRSSTILSFRPNKCRALFQ